MQIAIFEEDLKGNLVSNILDGDLLRRLLAESVEERSKKG